MAHPMVVIVFCFFLSYATVNRASGTEILSKSKLERCEKDSGSGHDLNCTRKIVINMAVPSGSSGGEASIVAEIVEVEENSSVNMQTLRIPPVITVNKSAAYALYELTYIRDVAYKPQEYYVKTRKCEPDAGANVVQICERLRDEKGHILEHTEPICCPCGPQRRVPSSCGNFFDKLMRGKANTAHCVRFLGDWFHVYGIGQRTMGFSVRVWVKAGTKVSEVIIGPENRTATSSDNFLRVNLIGDFAGYVNIPSFEDFYLVIPRQGEPGQPQDLGRNFSMWMLLERVRFSLDGVECNKIGVGYEAFRGQPNFCASPFWSCLHNQLWNFRDADLNRISRHQLPLYGVEGRFERINQHPNAGTHSFSIGITEALNTNLLIELSADDIEYVYQRSPGKIVSVTIPTFEALTQFGVATITAQNTGEVEASYSLTFDCSKGVALMEEQYFIMKPKETATRSFKLYPTTDQAAKYLCAAILKDSNFNEVDRAECQFSTTVTVLDNGSQNNSHNEFPVFDNIERHPCAETGDGFGYELIYAYVPNGELVLSKCGLIGNPLIELSKCSRSEYGVLCQITPFQPPKTGINGFFESIESLWNRFWEGLQDFITGKSCRSKCSGFFDFSCHIQYICMSWMVMFGLLLAIFPTVIVLLWLLHQKGLFDPLYDWWEDYSQQEQRMRNARRHNVNVHVHKHPQVGAKHHKHDAKHKRQGIHHHHHSHSHSERDSDYYYYLHHVHKDKSKHRGRKKSRIMQHAHLDGIENDSIGHHRHTRK